MGAYCTMNPQVMSKKTGKLENSKLFGDLKRAIGYNNARTVYIKVRQDSFVDEYDDMLAHDENGEFTLSSLKSVPELKKYLGQRARRTHAAKQVDAYSPVPATRESILDAETKAMEYNSKPGNEFIALPETYEDNSGMEIVQVQLVSNTPENREKASRISRKQILVSRISGMLERIGIPVSVFDDMIDRLRTQGMQEYDAVISIAENLKNVITKAEGGNVQAPIANDMASFAYAALSGMPVMDRLLSAIRSNGLTSAIFSEDELIELQNTFENEGPIYEVAAIKLISGYMLNGETDDMYADPDLYLIAPLMKRLDATFKNVFGSIDIGEISSYINEAERSPLSREFENEIEDNEEEVVFNQEAEEEKEKELKSQVEKQRDLLYSLIENSVRRYKILSKRGVDYDKSFDKRLTAEMSVQYSKEEYELGIYEFIEATLEQLALARNKLREIAGDNSISAERKASVLKNIKDFIQSYKVSIDAIKNAEYSGVIKPNAEMDDIINQATNMVGVLMSEYERQKNPLLISFIKRFVGEGIVVPFGKDKGKIYTAESLLEEAEKDITIFDRWLDSMAESGDMMLRIMDNASKQARSSARLQTLEYKRRIDAIYNRLKKSGITDTSFMYERDENGHKTGRYIKVSDASRLDPARRKYYDDMMALKKELDALLPKGATTLHNIIRIRKDYIERLKSQDSITGIMRETKEALRDKVKRRSDNPETNGEDEQKDEGGIKKTVLMDFSGRQVETLPLMFIKSKPGESLDDISEDTTSSMLMYANMASQYASMSNIVGMLELLREKITERPVQQRAGSKPLINVLQAFGINVTTNLTKSGESTKIVQRMNDWFSSQVYSKYMRDEGEILGMDIGMLANLSNEVTALNQFALNILSGISNVMTASAMNRIESICGQYFSVKDLAKADMTFWSALPEFLGDVGNPVKHSKLALFMELFNTMQDFENDIRDNEYGKSRFTRLMTTNSLYVINNAGELWIQNRAALAFGMSMGLRIKKGNTYEPISLWDALKVETNKDGVSKLVVIDGVVKSDGTKFGTTEDITSVTNKMKSLNQRMNGIYNYEDRCAAQAYSWGRMALMFRKWIKPSLNRRYGSLNYNFDIDEWEEGFYTTTGRFFMTLYEDLKRGQLDVVTTYKNLDPREKANLMRFAVEVGQFISVVAAFAILKDVKKKSDDDDDPMAKSWWFNQLLYQTRRLETEIGAQMVINPQMIQEAFNILKSPAACVNTWEGVANLTKLMIPSNYTTTLQTGRYKGHSRAYKLFWDSPLIPMHRTLYRGLHPQNSLQFYDNPT